VSSTRCCVGARNGYGRTCILAVVFALCSLVPLAHASLPDPLWIAGVYDGADFDEAVVAVVAVTALVAAPAMSGLPAAPRREAVRPVEVPPGAAASRSTFQIRAPPG
jgi:hypothetical protein